MGALYLLLMRMGPENPRSYRVEKSQSFVPGSVAAHAIVNDRAKQSQAVGSVASESRSQ